MDTSDRFVVLAHRVGGETHYDLMLEVAGQDRLRTYQLAKWPLAEGETCALSPLPDHRRVYLEYEGEVSGGRGEVRRVAAGVWSGNLRLNLNDGTVVDLELTAAQATRRPL